MKQHFWLTRVTVEADSPLAVGSGQGDGFRDALFVTGPGGLPYLPGTSLAGVLRNSWRSTDRINDDVFGKVQGGAVLSRISVSDGLVHNKEGLPQGLVTLPEAVRADSVLTALATGVTRDHVAIGHSGAATGRAKFDSTAVMAGARFTFEVRLDGIGNQPPSDEEVTYLRQLLATPLRVGGKTRRGYGKLRPLAASKCRTFDLSKAADRVAWCKLPTDLTVPFDSAGWQPLLTKGGGQPVATRDHLSLRLQLKAVDHLLMGGGSWLPDTVRAAVDTAEAKTPWSEQRIAWTGGQAKIDAEPIAVLPGTGIKGALRHRTVFHLHRLKGSKGLDSEAELEALFGSIRGQDDSQDTGTPGKVYIDDVVLTKNDWQGAEHHNHVSIDRYTGGPMPGLLFGDVTLRSLAFDLHLEVLGQIGNPTLKQAFVWALRDLAEGRLGLGAGQNAGYGFVQIQNWPETVEQLRPWLEAQ